MLGLARGWWLRAIGRLRKSFSCSRRHGGTAHASSAPTPLACPHSPLPSCRAPPSRGESPLHNKPHPRRQTLPLAHSASTHVEACWADVHDLTCGPRISPTHACLCTVPAGTVGLDRFPCCRLLGA